MSKKLYRAVGMLYKIRDYSPKHVLRTLYHGIFSSHLSYGLPVWGNADRVYLDCIIKLQNKAICAISFSSYTAHSKPIIKDFEILTLNDLTYHKMGSLMWDVDKNTLPPVLSSSFVKKDQIHHHYTRQAATGKYHAKSTNTTRYGTKSFQNLGTSILKDIKYMDIFKNARSKKHLLNSLKDHLLSAY